MLITVQGGVEVVYQGGLAAYRAAVALACQDDRLGLRGGGA